MSDAVMITFMICATLVVLSVISHVRKGGDDK